MENDSPRTVWRGGKSGAEDLALIKRLGEGDEAAFEALVAQHHNSLLRVALTFVDDPEVAAEVVQDTWLAVLNGLRSFEGRSSLKTWIFAILSNRARTRAVRERRSVPFSALTAIDAEDPAVEPSRFTAAGMWAAPPQRWDAANPEDRVLRGEAMAALQKGLTDLPPNQRAVVTLRDVEGLDSAEVCNILHISETNQRVLLHRGRSRLRALLERHFGDK